MSSNPISVKSMSIPVLCVALLAAAGTLVAYSSSAEDLRTPPAPAYATLAETLKTVDAPDAARAWKELLAAADAGDRSTLRQYVTSRGGDEVVESFCDLLIQVGAAHTAAHERLGLPAADNVLFPHADADAWSRVPGDTKATVCSVLPVCGANYEPVMVAMERNGDRWQVVVGESLRGTLRNEPAAVTVARLSRSAEVFRLAAAKIRAGTYAAGDEAVYAIQNDLWHAGLQCN